MGEYLLEKYLDDGGEWLEKSDTFVLCTKESLKETSRANELEKQAGKLQEKGIALLPMDKEEIQCRLKDLPKIVDDFFGRSWVDAFCGSEAASTLRGRLDAGKLAVLRRRLLAFYERVFRQHDPGLPCRFAHQRSAPLQEWFVLPDVDVSPSLRPSPEITRNAGDTAQEFSDHLRSIDPDDGPATGPASRPPVALDFAPRMRADEWLASSDRALVVGPPGSGKTTLLRYIALDLLGDLPRLECLVRRWPSCLPVWIPFAKWTSVISDSTGDMGSLLDVLQDWFHNWDEDELFALVEEGLKDERLLLLVDGLDEWVNEEAAQLALDRLQVFIDMRGCPAIATTRPLGLDRLGVDRSKWSVGGMSGLSQSQQADLAHRWFSLLATMEGDEATLDGKENSQIQADDFLTELCQNADLGELARTPLLLCLLIAFRLQNAALPSSRFKAYSLLVEQLLSAHPKRRRQAAAVLAAKPSLNDEEAKQALAYLAMYMHQTQAGSAINRKDAARVVEEFLGSDRGLALDRAQAKHLGEAVVNSWHESAGLLVKKSEQELGFFHRVFQDFLAATYLASQPFHEQLKAVQEHGVSPSWREIILSLLHLTLRRDETDKLIEAIRESEKSLLDRLATAPLRAEIACGEFRCSPALAQRLADDLLRQVEEDAWMPLRVNVVNTFLRGTCSSKIGDLLRNRLSRWFPRRLGYRSQVYHSMAHWPDADDRDDCLLSCLVNDDSWDRAAAIEAIGVLAQRNAAVLSKLLQLVRSAFSVDVVRGALRALIEAAPGHPEVGKIVSEIDESDDPESEVLYLLGRVRRHEHMDIPWQRPCVLADRDRRILWTRDGEIAELLAEGWFSSAELRMALLDAAKHSAMPSKIDDRVALRALVLGWPNDDDVAQILSDHLIRNTYVLNYGPDSLWRLLPEKFKDNTILTEAIDRWFSSSDARHMDIESHHAALVGRTEVAKHFQLDALESGKSLIHWPASSLVKGWPDDQQVLDKLREIALGQEGRASRIAHVIPRVLGDKREAARRLMAILKSPDCDRIDFVLAAMAEIGNEEYKQEAVDLVLGKLPSAKGLVADEAKNALIRFCPEDGRVRAIALQGLQNEDISAGVTASVYGHDEEIRKKIMAMLPTIPARLREHTAHAVATTSVGGDLAEAILKGYSSETDEGARVEGSVHYHRMLRRKGSSSQEALGRLREDMGSCSVYEDAKRMAALAGLVALDRLDVFANTRDARAGMSFRLALPSQRVIFENWLVLKKELGELFWLRLFGHQDPSLDTWEKMAQLADEFPEPREELVDYLQRHPGDASGTFCRNILSFLSRAKPKSRLLLEFCLARLRQAGSNWGSVEESGLAADIIVDHFSHRRDVLDMLVAGLDHTLPVNDPHLLAIVDGWPEEPVATEAWRMAKTQKAKPWIHVWMRFCCRMSDDPRAILNIVRELLNLPETARQYYSSAVIRPLLKRIARDAEVKRMMFSELCSAKRPSLKISLARLLAAASSVSQELRSWCVTEATRQMSGERVPEVGLDIVSGTYRTVPDSLLTILNPIA